MYFTLYIHNITYMAKSGKLFCFQSTVDNFSLFFCQNNSSSDIWTRTIPEAQISQKSLRIRTKLSHTVCESPFIWVFSSIKFNVILMCLPINLQKLENRLLTLLHQKSYMSQFCWNFKMEKESLDFTKVS